MSTGATIAELKSRSGLTWSQLADALGASSGDYVRKVASGAKPGTNLAGAVSQLMSTGKVSDAPARRMAKSGGLARVRASASTGARSRIPDTTAPTALPRRLFDIGTGRLGWAQETPIDSPETIAAAIRSAGRGHRRVSFRITYHDKHGRERVKIIGGKGGYSPRRALAEFKDGGAGWLADQAGKAAGPGNYGDLQIEADDITDVEVYAE